MENIINLYDGIADFREFKDSDSKNMRLLLYSCLEDLPIYHKNEQDADSIFSLWIEFGKAPESSAGYEKRIMVDVRLDELELFASSVLKHIEIIRKNYGEQIKKQYDMGNLI